MDAGFHGFLSTLVNIFRTLEFCCCGERYPVHYSSNVWHERYVSHRVRDPVKQWHLWHSVPANDTALSCPTLNGLPMKCIECVVRVLIISMMYFQNQETICLYATSIQSWACKFYIALQSFNVSKHTKRNAYGKVIKLLVSYKKLIFE